MVGYTCIRVIKTGWWAKNIAHMCMILHVYSVFVGRSEERKQFGKSLYSPSVFIWILTYSLTPWKWVLEKLTRCQLVKKFRAFFGTRKFITEFIRALSAWTFRNMICSYGEELLAPRPTLKLEDQSLSAVRDCLFNLFAATLHIGGCSSIHNLRTRHPVVTGTHFSRIHMVIKELRHCYFKGCIELTANGAQYSLTQ